MSAAFPVPIFSLSYYVCPFQLLFFWWVTDKLLADPTENPGFISLLKSCDLFANA